MNDEDHRRHAQRMESVGQLTGGMAHDFNNLLTVIQGNLQALQELQSVQRDAACTPLVNAALRAARRGADLTRSLLAFSRRQKLAPQAVQPAELLRSMVEMLRRTLDPRIKLEVMEGAACPPCLADPAMLESTLLNIAINARDAMPDGGTLTWHAWACDVLPDDARTSDESLLPQGYVAISIRDTGVGMAPEVIDRAFEPFFTTKELGRGTGLGLSVAYGFIRQSEGAIVIESQPGAGTCITLYLPRERRLQQNLAPQRLRSTDALLGMDVMLVEDDLEVMAVTLSFLAHLGCRVRAYASGEHAILALGREPLPRLLLSDVALGEGMRGTELATQVNASWPPVQVLLMSGYVPELDDIAQATAMNDLLSKPFSRDELAEAMLRVLGRVDAGEPLP